MTICRRTVMNTAWTDYRSITAEITYARHQLRSVFATCLKNAWVTVKNAAILAARTVVSLKAEIEHLRNKTRLDYHGQDRITALQSAVRAAEARQAESANIEKRALIASAAGRFCTVDFTKADGSERTMRIQPAKLKLHVKGRDASEAGSKAAVTRALRHPHLMPVWDADKAAPRSVNLSTVSRITVDGQTHTYAA